MFQSMSKEGLASKGAILTGNVEEGLRQYQSVILKGGKQAMEAFLMRCLEENNDKAYADFYYAVLEKEQKEQFEAGLDEKEKSVFSEFETDRGWVYYPLQEENLGFLAGITARNWLFSTFYFTGHKAVVWGNYNLEYPLFCEDLQTLEFYKNIAAECGLELL